MPHGRQAENVKVSRLYQFRGLKRIEEKSARAEDIVALSASAEINISKNPLRPELRRAAARFIKIDEPTVAMTFLVNDSPCRPGRHRHQPEPAGQALQGDPDQRL